jgi:hypothetical protein
MPLIIAEKIPQDVETFSRSRWRPYLPEPRPAVVELGDPEPVPLDALRAARRLCADFRVPPRQFRRRTARGADGQLLPRERHPSPSMLPGQRGAEWVETTVTTQLSFTSFCTRQAIPGRLARTTSGDFSPAGSYLEEGTILAAQRIVLREIGFGGEALEWHAEGARITCRSKGGTQGGRLASVMRGVP